MKDRDKGLKIHLCDTVEGLKKFNARRKLKSVILAAVNSSKWYPYDDSSDNFSDFGDEEVSSCGKFVSHLIYCLLGSGNNHLLYRLLREFLKLNIL